LLTTAKILAEQERQADAERERALRKEMPSGLTPLRTLQFMLWGWADTRQRTSHRWHDPYLSFSDLPAVADEILEAAGVSTMLGKRKSASAQYDPVLKFDARNGKIVRCDRVQEGGEWVTVPHEIPLADFEAVFDVANLKVGWICFSPPDFKLVPVGEDYGDPPSDKHKEGFRVRVLLRDGAGDGWHEVSATSIALWDSMSELHGEWEAGHAEHRGQLPVVGVEEMISKTTAQGTSYRPAFTIKDWIVMPKEFGTTPKTVKAGKAKAKGKAAQLDLLSELP
jgi:hypothetical protein